MRRSVPLALDEKQRSLLERWSRGGSTPYRIVMRARIVLLSSQGCSIHEVARRLRTNPITVARWRSRFELLGVEGIRREAPRSGSPPPVPDSITRKVVFTTLYVRPPGRARWSTRSLARAIGVSHTTVRRIWKGHGLGPHRSRLALLTQDPRLRPRAADLVGVYVNPPHRAVALGFGDSSPAAPAARRGSGPEESGSSSRASRPWIADLAATLNLLDQSEPIRTTRRYSEQEFLAFLRTVREGHAGPEKVVLLGPESGPALSPPLEQWLRRHPQVSTEVCTGTEQWKQKVVDSIRGNEEGRLRRPPLAGVTSFLTAVNEWQREGSGRVRPFAWTRVAKSVPRRASSSRHVPVGYS